MALRNLALNLSGGIRSIHRSRGTVESLAGQGAGSRAHAPGWPGQEPDQAAGLLPRLAETPDTALKPGPGGRAAGLVSGTHKHRAKTRETHVVVLITQRQQKRGEITPAYGAHWRPAAAE
jgi:hypothetical protein